jgi:hypothetical protein
MSMSNRDSDGKTESRRILDRVSREAESGGSFISRTAKHARDHMAAEDADKGDWAEYWGTRIGRGLGIVLLVCLLIWLILFVMRG